MEIILVLLIIVGLIFGWNAAGQTLKWIVRITLLFIGLVVLLLMIGAAIGQ